MMMQLVPGVRIAMEDHLDLVRGLVGNIKHQSWCRLSEAIHRDIVGGGK